MFLPEASVVNLDILEEILTRYQSDYGIFIGNEITDNGKQ
jgi:hypothetical protein